MSEAPLLSAQNLVKNYEVRGGSVSALDDVSFELKRGEILGLVGESGCGKSSLARVIMQLLTLDSGRLTFDDVDLATCSKAELHGLRRRFQMIFQDPFSSLNPRTSVGRILEEPLIVHKMGDKKERKEKVRWLLEKVGMSAEMADRMPHEFSGGQRQRIGIARAIALNPDMVICDEPVSALDVSIQAQVLNLLLDLKEEFNLTYLFISHDLSVVNHIADRVAVMYLGNIVEIADCEAIFERPRHHYTELLLKAFPMPDPRKPVVREEELDKGELPSPINPPSGCRFRTRCKRASEKCAMEKPLLREIEPGHMVACHFPIEQ